MSRPSRLFPVLLFLLPFCLLGWWLREHAYKELIWDDWELLADRFPGPGLIPNWEGLFTPYAGHRIPWLQLSVIPGVLWGDGDMRYLLFLSFTAALVVAWNLNRLNPLTPRPAWWDTLIISLAVASPIYSQSWQWWICWPIFVPFTCVVLGIRLLTSENQKTFWWRFGGALGLSVIALFAHGSGGLAWLALLPCLWCALSGQSRPIKISAYAIYIALGIVSILPFLCDLPDEVGNDATTLSATRPFHLIHYALTLAGGSLGQGISANPVVPSKILGALFVVDAALLSLLLISRYVRPGLRRQLCPWVSVTWFGLLSTVAIAAGRSELPDQQALEGRYLLLTYPLWLGLYFAFRILLSHGFFRVTEQSRIGGVVLVTTLLGVLQTNSWLEGWLSLRHNHARHLSDVAAVNFVRLFPHHSALSRASVDVGGMADLLDRLDREKKVAGYRLFSTHDFAQFGLYSPLKPIGGGHVTEAAVETSGDVRIEGYAYLHHLDRPADLIILTVEPPGDESQRKIFDLVPVIVNDDFYHSYERFRRPEKFTMWSSSIPKDRLPQDEAILRAWAFDHERKRVHILRNTLRIQDGVLAEFVREVKGRDVLP